MHPDRQIPARPATEANLAERANRGPQECVGCRETRGDQAACAARGKLNQSSGLAGFSYLRILASRAAPQGGRRRHLQGPESEKTPPMRLDRWERNSVDLEDYSDCKQCGFIDSSPVGFRVGVNPKEDAWLS